MTTASWNTVLDQSTDAAFRVWGSELNTKFAAVGMVNTADTGQINWTTVTRAGNNTAAGYEIWRLSSSALYFKIEYGSGSANTVPSLWITVGTGSNGSGTLTGQTCARHQIGYTSTAITSTVTNYQSYLCATADYFGLSWKIASTATAGQARLFVSVMRTVDSTGAATSTGFALVSQNANATGGVSTLYQQCVATTAAVTGADGATNNPATFCFVPGNYASAPSTSQDGAGNNQAFLWWYSILGTAPIQPLLHAAGILAIDLTVGNTAAMTLVGSSSHTYICATLGLRFGDPAGYINVAQSAVVMLWE